MRKRLNCLILIVASIGFASSHAYADQGNELFNNGVVNPTIGLRSDDPVGGVGERAADRVLLQESGLIQQVTWKGRYSSQNGGIPSFDNFTLTIHRDDNGQPAIGAPIRTIHLGGDVERVVSPLNPFEFEYQVDVEFCLPGGGVFWISIFNDTSSFPMNTYFWLGDENKGNAHSSENNGNLSWDPEQVRLDFKLCGQSILLGDINRDGFINLLDVDPFVDILTLSSFQFEADINCDGDVNLLDVALFVELIQGG